MMASETVTAGLQLVKDNGLIVLALLALMWQVWFVSSSAKDQQNDWRMTINTMQANILEEQKQRNENIQKLTEAMVKVYEVMRTTQLVVSDMEEECQSEVIRKHLQQAKSPSDG